MTLEPICCNAVARSESDIAASAPLCTSLPWHSTTSGFLSPVSSNRTTADRKGCGDTDEEWSRAYRRNGAVRLTITLPDGATKVMHAPDPTPRARFDDFLATILPVELLPQDYIRDVVLGSDHMEPQELKLYG